MLGNFYSLDGNLEHDENFKNRAFYYGDGVFETISFFNGNLLFLNKHFHRLQEACHAIKINFPPFSLQELASICFDLLTINKISNSARIRIQVFRKGSLGFTPQNIDSHYLIEVIQSDSIFQPKEEGIKVAIYDENKLHFTTWSPFKTCNALHYILASKYAKVWGFDDAFLVDSQNNLVELTSSNLFFVQNNKLNTPPINSGCVEGIMRSIVIHSAKNIGIPIIENSLKFNELNSVTEIFSTNVVKGIQPIRSIKGFSSTFTTEHNYMTKALWEYIKDHLNQF